MIRKSTGGGASRVSTINTAGDANGIEIVGDTIRLHAAASGTGGAVTAGTQTIGGNKTFTGSTLFNGVNGISCNTFKDSNSVDRFTTGGNGGAVMFNSDKPGGASNVMFTFKNQRNAFTTAGGSIVALYRDNAITLVARIDKNGFYVQPVQTATVADDEAGTKPTLTITPTSNSIRVTCNDPQGVDVTMGETGVQDGTRVTIFNVSANAVDFADSAGVQELAGACSLGQYDSLTLEYVTDRWIEISRANA